MLDRHLARVHVVEESRQLSWIGILENDHRVRTITQSATTLQRTNLVTTKKHYLINCFEVHILKMPAKLYSVNTLISLIEFVFNLLQDTKNKKS